jgi:hypothetical protein
MLQMGLCLITGRTSRFGDVHPSTRLGLFRLSLEASVLLFAMLYELVGQ